ncbi:WhiB family transcriptional regulator [Streptomyces sp. NPDC102264]|uniref:WhiB family transcriptional regulator n=1 Tax=Streptomyces sp. NPDC102264 TaxID=3366149 RepID=UPI0037FA2939
MTNTSNWRDDAACLNHTAVFFPRKDNEADTATAKKICGICPVRTICLDDALATEVGAEESRAGIRGGKTPKQRVNLARRRRKARAAA